MPLNNAIEQVIPPREESLGAIPVRRLLPARERQMIGPFIFMDQGGPITVPYTPGGGVPEHPHAGLATFTYAIQGSLRHRDSAGYSVRIRPGDIALMHAGSGITHEELADPDHPSPTRDIYFLQMWLALPDEHEEMEPSLEHFSEQDLPLIERAGARIRLLMGEWDGERAPTTCLMETLFANIELATGAALPIAHGAAERALMLLEGDAHIGATPLSPYSLYLLAAGEQPQLVTANGCRVILLGGGTFPSRRWIAGSFVGSSEDKILGWMRAYQAGRFPRIQPLNATMDRSV